jgi:gliding motility-associated-like protein
MYKKVIISLTMIFFMFYMRASHIIGGDMYYNYLGNNQYRVYIALYRDCASTGAQYDDPLSLGIFTPSGVFVQEILIFAPPVVNLPVIFDNPCVTPPSGICVERAIYETVITLPPNTTGYMLAYQRCCRGPNITNLINPDDTGLTLTSLIPGTVNSNFINSSPRYTNYPPLVICNNENLIFDHSATDPDGDLLTYELTTPYQGANGVAPMPQPPPAPPYTDVFWGAGYNENLPLGPGSVTTINPNTGQLFVDANLTGLFVVGIRVNEWRGGVIINSTVRDFVFKVVNCVIQLEALVTEQEDTPGFIGYCHGLNFTFENTSYGANSYSWDFGVAGSTADISSDFEPSFTFPGPGTYEVTMIANPGWPCTDTARITIILDNPFDVNFTFTDSLCFIGHEVDFTSVILGPPGTQYYWSLGPNASIQTATTQNVNNVTFSTPNGNEIYLLGVNNVCRDSITKPIFFYQPPTSQFELPANYICEGFDQSFVNESTNGLNYLWDFGVPGITTDVSTQLNPTYTFPGPGLYPITLITSSAPGCADTSALNIELFEELDLDFVHNDSLCIVNNSFNFSALVSGPPIATYTWNFGPNADLLTSTNLVENDINYSTPGVHTISLTGSFLQCTETISKSIFIFREPLINFKALDTSGCEPFLVQFIDQSSSDSPLIHSWDFGDGNTSDLANPSYLYQNSGFYTITHAIQTNIGCIDTLELVRPSYIVVHPTPVAAFSIDKTEMDICNAVVQFNSNSQGEIYHSYNFDEIGGEVSSEENPLFQYGTAGTHNPYLIVENEFGCTDTARKTLTIDPFVVYAPNTFTPEGNVFNNYFYAVSYLDALSWKMELFNRWGERVFLSEDQNEKWDGTYNNQKCPDGVYTYKLTYIPCGLIQDEIITTGHVNLLR